MQSFKDPYKDRKYGIVQGDKRNDYFRIEFKEGKFYATDNGYVLLADVTTYKGVVKAFKPDDALEPGICAIFIYKQEYELWTKGRDGKFTLVKTPPSLMERNLAAYLATTIDDTKHYKGSVGFLPDDQLTDVTDEELATTITRNCKLEEVEATGKLPEYKADSGSSKKNNSGGYKVSPTDKVKWLKKELVSSIKDGGYNEDMSLIDLVDQIVSESEDENTLAIYTDLLKATLN